MARPKPNVLLEYVDQKTYKIEQILESDAVYAVFYKGAAINIKSSSYVVSLPAPKYKKSSFGSSGHAFNLADRLNKLFNTDEFKVYKLTAGEVLEEFDSTDEE